MCMPTFTSTGGVQEFTQTTLGYFYAVSICLKTYEMKQKTRKT